MFVRNDKIMNYGVFFFLELLKKELKYFPPRKQYGSQNCLPSMLRHVSFIKISHRNGNAIDCTHLHYNGNIHRIKREQLVQSIKRSTTKVLHRVQVILGAISVVCLQLHECEGDTHSVRHSDHH